MHSILKFYTKKIFKFVHQIYYILINLKELKIRKKMGSKSSCLWNYFLISTVRLNKALKIYSNGLVPQNVIIGLSRWQNG